MGTHPTMDPYSHWQHHPIQRKAETLEKDAHRYLSYSPTRHPLRTSLVHCNTTHSSPSVQSQSHLISRSTASSRSADWDGYSTSLMDVLHGFGNAHGNVFRLVGGWLRLKLIALVWEWKWRGVFSFTNAARFLH